MSSLRAKPDPANGTGAKRHRDGLLVCLIDLAAMAYYPGYLALANLAIPER